MNNDWKQQPIPQSRSKSKGKGRNYRDASKKGKGKGKGSRVYKPGPREIGRNDGWKQKVVITQKAKNQSVFEAVTRNNKRKERAQKIYKPGPRDIGRNDYNGYTYDHRQSVTKLNKQH